MAVLPEPQPVEYLQDEWKILPRVTLNFGGRFGVRGSGFGVGAPQFGPRRTILADPSNSNRARRSSSAVPSCRLDGSYRALRHPDWALTNDRFEAQLRPLAQPTTTADHAPIPVIAPRAD